MKSQKIINQRHYRLGHSQVEMCRPFEYAGPVAHCGMGRPILTTGLHRLPHGRRARSEGCHLVPIVDAAAYPSAGQAAFSSSRYPKGQGVSSAPGVGAVAKTILDTTW